MNKLISLVRFYGISHHQLLASEIVDSDESDDNDGPIEVQTLEEIVLSHPKRAQEALAEKLGLKYEKIAIFMERVKAFRQEAATGKRPATASYEEQWNKRRLPPPEDHRVSSSPDVPPGNRYLWSYFLTQTNLHRPLRLTPIRPASSGVKVHACPAPLLRTLFNTTSRSPPRLTHPNRRYLPLLLSLPSAPC